ncbi:heme exporter protein CcmD [Ramlibacter sp.]|uniref:heme exporter protein CcmD n=1 Tax=Ramlibacter sp. TaxID=1917967 RepID=UPI003D098A86
MHWSSFSDFVAMGGYGLYVWGSFGVCALAMVAEPLLVRRRRAAAVQGIQRRARAEQYERENP